MDSGAGADDRRLREGEQFLTSSPRPLVDEVGHVERGAYRQNGEQGGNREDHGVTSLRFC